MITVNETQREHLSEHYEALELIAHEARWVLGDTKLVDYTRLKFCYDEAVRLMESIRIMHSAVENNQT